MIFRQFSEPCMDRLDGPGERLVINFQGCLKKCEYCRNKDLWAIYGGSKKDTETVKKEMVSLKKDYDIRGITFAGGEPFLQPVAALDMAKFARSRGLDVWCYTGYSWDTIAEWEDTRKQLLKEIDVLIEGPYDESKQDVNLIFRKSNEQRLIDVQKSLEKGEVVEYVL